LFRVRVQAWAAQEVELAKRIEDGDKRAKDVLGYLMQK